MDDGEYSSVILNTILPVESSHRPLPEILPQHLLTIAQSTTESVLDLIIRQQEQIQKKLSHQDYLYKNLLEQRGGGPASATTIPKNLLNLLNKRGQYFGDESSSPADATAGAGGGLGFLSALWPGTGNVVDGLGSMFERVFGFKFWFSSLVALIVLVALGFLICFCTYCCCCTPVGRLCCKCSLFGRYFGAKKKSGEKSGGGVGKFKSTSFGSSKNDRRHCCV
jgi:hypothetical protein